MLPNPPAWLNVLHGQLPRHHLSTPNAEALALEHGWSIGLPWFQLRKLFSLLLDMTPCDVTAVVPAAERIGFNLVALLIMAMAKHSEFICEWGALEPTGLLRCCKLTPIPKCHNSFRYTHLFDIVVQVVDNAACSPGSR